MGGESAILAPMNNGTTTVFSSYRISPDSQIGRSVKKGGWGRHGWSFLLRQLLTAPVVGSTNCYLVSLFEKPKY